MITLMPHQQKAVMELRNGCILRGPTGSGKTITALAYYTDTEPIERLIVITTAMKRDSGDWQSEARFFGLFPEVDSWQNMHKYRDVEGAFFIFDEQRVVGSGGWVRSFLKITKKNKWILLSATPGDTWLDYIPVLIANGFYSTRTEFLEEHVIFDRWSKYPKVKRYLGTSKLERLLDSITVEMPYERNTVRHEIDVYCEYDRELYSTAWNRRWNFLEDRPIRQISELFSLVRRVVNTDPSRLHQVRNLMIKHPKVIIFYNFDYELDILRRLTVKIAEWNGHKHEEIPGGSEWAYLVQYAAGAEAWGCTETDTMIFYSMTYSYRSFTQAHGRIDRLDTEFVNLWYYTLRSSSPVENGIRATLLSKRSFNERLWIKKNP
jgi:hypothetical protein